MRLKPRGNAPPVEDLDAIPERLFDTDFRSRLEARHAIFFHELGLGWQYEREPVRVDGRNRWPDFWLDEPALWVEVKPYGTPADTHLALSIAERTGSGLLWLAGVPWPGGYTISYFPAADRPPIANLRWALGRRDHSELWLCDPGAVLAIRLSPPLTGPLTWEEAQGIEFPLFDCHALREAYRRASAWRFNEV